MGQPSPAAVSFLEAGSPLGRFEEGVDAVPTGTIDTVDCYCRWLLLTYLSALPSPSMMPGKSCAIRRVERADVS
jgi:hypothetical protein